MTQHVVAHDPDGNEVLIKASFAICMRCDGEGTHVNPAIDSNGITSDEMEELGDDFREAYMSGGYDISCSNCSGSGKVLEGDPNDPNYQHWLYDQQDRHEMDAIERQERAMGA